MAAPMLQIKARQPAAWVALYQSETRFKNFIVKVGVISVADPGFPRGGAPTLRGAPTYDVSKFPQKLHEIERIWTARGRASLMPSLDPPLDFDVASTWSTTVCLFSLNETEIQ